MNSLTCGFRLVAFVVTGMCVAPGLSLGQSNDTPVAERPYSVSELGLDFDVPQSPAFTVLDLSPTNVTKPESPRDFAAALLNGLDRNGNFQSGLSLELNPWGVFNRNWGNLNISEGDDEGYIDGSFSLTRSNFWEEGRWLRYLWYRSSLSVATTKGSDDEDEALRLALGLKMTPWDLGDSRMLVGKCIREKVTSLVGVLQVLRPDSGNHFLSNTLAERAKTYADTTPKSADEQANEKRIASMVKSIDELDFAGRYRGTRGSDLSEAINIAQQRLSVKLDAPADQETLPADCAAFAVPDRVAARRICTHVAQGKVAAVQKHLGEFQNLLAKFESLLAAQGTARPDKATRNAQAALAGTTDQLSKRDLNAVAIKWADSIYDTCRQENETTQGRSAWDVAIAPSWISEDGSTDGMRWNGGGIWTSLALGTDLLADPNRADADTPQGWDKLSLILHGRYRFDQRVPISSVMSMPMEPAATTSGAEVTPGLSEDMFMKQDSWIVGARVKWMLSESLGISLEGSINDIDVEGMPAMGENRPKDDTFYQFALIPTFKVPGTGDLWIDVAIGTDTDRKGDNDDAFILSSIKYGFGTGPWRARQAAD